MFLRPARLTDLSSLLTIEHTCFPLGIAFNPPQIRRLLRNDRAHCIVAVDQGDNTKNRIAGWAVGLIRQNHHHPSARLYTLAIDPDYQGQGLGRLLTNRLLRTFKRQKVQHVYLEVRTKNDRAIALYHAMGFTKVRELPGYYEDGADGLRMRLTLAT